MADDDEMPAILRRRKDYGISVTGTEVHEVQYADFAGPPMLELTNGNGRVITLDVVQAKRLRTLLALWCAELGDRDWTGDAGAERWVK